MSAKTNARNKHSQHDTPIDITQEEFSRIADAFKKEEFRKLFFDYIEEIQDPENRKIYEAELKQFEAERGVDLKFINPEPGFVVKTSIDGVLKCFVNVASNAEIAKPSNEVCMNPETGKRGISWAIPMAQAPPRDDMDAHEKRCRVFDVVFHPDALYLAQRNAAFRKCLIDTALDAVEREYKAKLDRVNLKFPKLQYKGMPRPTVIRKLLKNPPPEAAEPHPLDKVSPAKPTEESAKPRIVPMTTGPKAPAPEFSIPNYLIKHRRDVDLAEYTDELDAKLNVTVPHELVIEIELPLLNSTTECQLDVTQKTLYLLSERAGAKYRLSLDLPYVVDDKNGTARFDTDTRRLSITLPVQQQSVSKQRDMHEALLHLNREDSGVESDVREELNSNSNSESPVEELSDSIEEDHEEEDEDDVTTKEDGGERALETSSLPSTPMVTSENFLKNSVHYQLPTKFDCNVLDNIMSLVLHVRNVQSDSIAILQQSKSVHLRFTSIGSGFYPTHYAFYLQLPMETAVDIVGANAVAWENNIVLDVQLNSSSELIQRYLVGLDYNDLKEQSVRDKLQLTHNSRQRQRKRSPITPPISLSSSLDISVERSECERSVEIEIKPHEQHSTAAANTTEDEETRRDDMESAQKKLSKKQRKKNKKRRSLSESACDDLKAYHQQQQQHMQQQQNLKAAINTNTKAKAGDGNDDDFSSPERQDDVAASVSAKISSSFVAVPMSSTAQQRKQRSYSECRSGDSVITGSSVDSSTLPPSFKGILKRYSRYEPRPSISDSCSSIDECSSLYSCSVDAGMPHSLRFSQSFSDIPEENVSAELSELSESCKKTVRFNEVIMKQVFRLDSSILGQRKKNQKRRDRKLRALQRRLSEGDSADYEDNNKPLQTDIQFFKSKGNGNGNVNIKSNYMKKCAQHDSGLDLTHNNNSNSNKGGNASKPEAKNNKSNKRVRPHLDSESSSDVDGIKNSMMFEMDM